ncbi:hypothetical protein ACFZA9_11930 [Streptomyces olivaceus]|uniref:hypothetical protein n=1 Tax=Streptomyces olivaceus TaxID=47716 RepID=UPI0036F1001B
MKAPTIPTTMQWIRQAGQRIHTGSGRLATHLAGRAIHRARRLWNAARSWLADASGVAWLVRLALLLAAAAVARKVGVAIGRGLYTAVDDGRAPWLMWGAAGLWVVAAYRCGRDGWEPKRRPAEASGDEQPDGAAAVSKDGPETSPAAAPGSSVPLPVSPVALVAAVRDVGTPNAQLKPLAEHLGTTTDTVRAAAADLGWPVKDVRQAGRSASAGLRWDECPTPAPLDPSPGVVGAGQPADDNDDDGRSETPREGLRVVRIGTSGRIVYDPADTVRHHPVRDQ